MKLYHESESDELIKSLSEENARLKDRQEDCDAGCIFIGFTLGAFACFVVMIIALNV